MKADKEIQQFIDEFGDAEGKVNLQELFKWREEAKIAEAWDKYFLELLLAND